MLSISLLPVEKITNTYKIAYGIITRFYNPLNEDQSGWHKQKLNSEWKK